MWSAFSTNAITFSLQDLDASGLPDGTPDQSVSVGSLAGTWNAITDVPGVRVGHTTLISGTGALEVGKNNLYYELRYG